MQMNVWEGRQCLIRKESACLNNQDLAIPIQFKTQRHSINKHWPIGHQLDQLQTRQSGQIIAWVLRVAKHSIRLDYFGSLGGEIAVNFLQCK